MSELVRQTLTPLTVQELKILAHENGLSTTGNKADLIERLINPTKLTVKKTSQAQTRATIAKTTQVFGQEDSRKEAFFKDLKSQPSLRDLVPHLNKKKGISISFYQIDEDTSNSPSPPSYLVAIKGRFDEVLIDLAKTPYRVPRGLFCYWIPEIYLEIFGFLPKFENDREYQTNNQSEFSGANELRISLKASGSLGMRHVVKSPLTGQLLVFYTSKKATNNPYADKFQALTEARYNEKELDKLDQWQVEHGFTLCAEVCFENNHGALVVAPNFFVTIISQAKKINLKTNKITGAVGLPLVEYLPDQIMVDYCKTYNIPIDDRFIISSIDNCSDFIQSLNERRDFMTIQIFYQLITQFVEQKKLKIIKGTLSHQTVFGQDGALEGLIIHVTKPNVLKSSKLQASASQANPSDLLPQGRTSASHPPELLETESPQTESPQIESPETTETIKYKFPNYTCRTFGVRMAVGNQIFSPIEYRKHVRNYLQRWVLTEIGQNYWGSVMFGAFQQIPKFTQESESSEWINNGGHILAIDWGITHPIKEHEFIISDQESNLTYDVNLVLVLGPVGSGKTTIAQALAPPGYNPIDGDRIAGLSLAQTMLLGQERTPLTVWVVIQDLIKYQLAIVSTGGGAFKNVRKLIAEFLPMIKMHLTIYIPTMDVSSQVSKDSPATMARDSQATMARDSQVCKNIKLAKEIATQTFELASQPGGITEKTIIRRLETKEWLLPSGQNQSQFIDRIITNVNRNNLNIVHEFIEEANCIMTFPVVTKEQFVKQPVTVPEEYVYQKTNNLKLPDLSLDRTIKIESFNYQQKRLLVGYQLPAKNTSAKNAPPSISLETVFTAFGHVTEAFNMARVIESTAKISEPIYNVAQPWQMITFDAGKMSLLLPPVDHPMFIELPDAHVTINSGKHYPVVMKQVTRALRNQQTSVELKTKSGDTIIYDLPQLSDLDKPVMAEIICRFYI